MQKAVARLLVIAAVSCALTDAAAGAQDAYTLARTTVFTVPSTHTGAGYRLHVSLPAGHDTSKEAFPVVYVLDGDWYFGLTVSMSRLLEAVGEQRPAIVVAIGYGGSVADQRRRRQREFTPGPQPTFAESGHAAGFLQALRHDIIPAIESRYRAGGERALVGHSLGGLFAAYAMTRAPELFRHVVIGSPAFWAVGDGIIDDVTALLRSKGPKPARIFVGVSDKDGAPIRASTAALVKALEAHAPADVTWRAADFADSTHQSSIAPLVAAAIPFVLPAR